ncbi:MAG: hypothetical protein QOK01_1660 [Alphaproteobacteria bacterium]|nr:hypothetical protein [Alphaproteobacteria bacterium]
MRVLLIPTVIVGVLALTGSDEPTESAMRAAFETTLAAQVRSALDFVAETGGQPAIDKVRAARTDEFDIRSFTKLNCAPSAAKAGHVCGFAVRIGVVNGLLEQTMTGRFYAGPHGLVFENQDTASAGA